MEKQFYKYFNVAPVMLSNCTYHNEFTYGIEYGEDVCEFVDEDPETNHCKTCKKAEQLQEYYPSITEDVLLRFVLICSLDIDWTGKSVAKASIYDIKEKILNSIMYQVNKDSLVGITITQILNAHKAEMLRW